MILFSFRCKGLHGLDAQLLLKLGKTYECHALEASATADADEHAHKMVAVLEARAALYFKVILHYWLHGFRKIMFPNIQLMRNKVAFLPLI